MEIQTIALDADRDRPKTLVELGRKSLPNLERHDITGFIDDVSARVADAFVSGATAARAQLRGASKPDRISSHELKHEMAGAVRDETAVTIIAPTVQLLAAIVLLVD